MSSDDSKEQKAPSTVRDVIDFWFGWEDWKTGKTDTEAYRGGKFRFWFSGGKQVDDECKAFIPLIEAANQGKLTGQEWTTVDGLSAQLILLDQMSRNCFRGTEKAFAFDTQAQKTATSLISMIRDNPSDLPAAGLLFVSTCYMHSEDLALHEALTAFIKHTIAVSAPCDVIHVNGAPTRKRKGSLRWISLEREHEDEREREE